ncbi:MULTISPECIES: TetR/AcrR family transcriptional regulator [Streptomyces]|uniref:TetR/AcrR family transcriptional regulator n=1 Tax=Streptomyces TaxID=1883 RepID=UPI0016762795|nr:MULTISPECIES: TetR family transcriptional regulator [Streptomyces]MBD3575309.1 TetR family transcriptional regulator [Streptomyces sp. KD18]GGS92225.1 TetR family transcriptional regulator [Streptomyces toxytricini]
MSPRGVAIPDLRARLFEAAERVLARDGAAALTSRAVTAEAGCAKGVLHTHFAGLDEFVAELVLDRFARTAELAAALPAQAGDGTPAGNLADVASAVLALDPGVVGLAVTRPAAAMRVREAWAAGAPGFGAIQASVEAYLNAERALGRVAPTLDTVSAALALVGTLHHLLMTAHPAAPRPHTHVQPLLRTLLGTP